VVLQPSPSNGCKKVSYLLPQSLTCVAKTRITAAELQQLRQLVVLTIGGLS
jgi:mRNA interferase MazF